MSRDDNDLVVSGRKTFRLETNETTANVSAHWKLLRVTQVLHEPTGTTVSVERAITRPQYAALERPVPAHPGDQVVAIATLRGFLEGLKA